MREVGLSMTRFVRGLKQTKGNQMKTKMAFITALAAAALVFSACNDSIDSAAAQAYDPLNPNANKRVPKCNDEEVIEGVLSVVKGARGRRESAAVYTLSSFITEGVDKDSHRVSCRATLTTQLNGKSSDDYIKYTAVLTDDGKSVQSSVSKAFLY